MNKNLAFSKNPVSRFARNKQSLILRNKLLVICGPTATGKTSLGIRLAKKFGGEIVSADSRQVYQGMDIGTGKDLPANSKFAFRQKTCSKQAILSSKQILNSKFEIPNYQVGCYKIDSMRVWLYDVVEPNYQFSVADYVKCANLVIKDIRRRGKLPILVGGTGLYIKGLVDGIGTMGIPPDLKLRKKLSNLQIEKLREILKGTCPERLRRMNESDRRNPRRLVRAIEIAKQAQSSKLKAQNHNLKLKTDKILFIGLTAPYKILYGRIDKRVDERVRQGIIEEIGRLLEKGYLWENSVLGTTIGYKEWKACFTGSQFTVHSSQLRKEVIQRWKYNEHAYARRQMTWFKKALRQAFGPSSGRGAQGYWFDISQKEWQDKVKALVEKWYS